MDISLLEYIIHSGNYFPHKGNIRKTLGANTILLAIPNPDINMKLFLSYSMVYTRTKTLLSAEASLV